MHFEREHFTAFGIRLLQKLLYLRRENNSSEAKNKTSKTGPHNLFKISFSIQEL